MMGQYIFIEKLMEKVRGTIKSREMSRLHLKHDLACVVLLKKMWVFFVRMIE